MRKLLLATILMLCTLAGYGQQKDKDDRKEATEERKAANKDRVDYTVFRRQILTLTEFSDERRKLAQLKSDGKGIGKIYAVVDSTNEQPDDKFLKGYIQLLMGDNTANVYELTFDRNLKRIILVRPTGEQLEVEKATPASRRPAAAKPPLKTKPKKKTGDDDEEEEADEEEAEETEKPVRGKKKEKEDEE
ncbi:MAG: hypothetical protein IAE95_12880 [Chitinophagaceae bacterium]|nr:hypothetical protein [Chitinophagaceae bacterium]